MVRIGKIEGVDYDFESQSLNTAGSTKHNENMFEYELSAPTDSYSIASGSSDWNSSVANMYKNLGLNNYTWFKINNFNDAVIKSQNNLIDLLRMYEGSGDNFEAKTNYKDTLGISTYGFGLTTLAMRAIDNYKDGKVINCPTTQAKAYEQLLKYLNKVSLPETKKYLDNVNYDSMPSGIKAALLDYHFKNGYGIMKKSKLRVLLQTATENKTAESWAAVLKELVYAQPASSTAEKKDNPGLYKRSLSRVILAAIDLKKTFSSTGDIEIIDKAVKEVYEAAVKCSKANDKRGLADIEEIYKAYTGNNSSNTESDKVTDENAVENKYIVPEKFGVYSAANAIMPDSIPGGINSSELRKKIIDKIIELNNMTTYGVDTNGYPKVDILEKGMQLILPDKVEMDNSVKIRLKAPSNWTLVSGEVSQNDEVVSEEINDEQIRTIDLLNKECPNPVYSNIGKDKNLKCATYQYKVQEGNTIYRLALRYGVDWKTLLADNDMDENSTLNINQKIKINKIVYIVQRGDNLTKIASKYGLTIDYMRDINNLEDVNDLKIGQQLEIPGYVYTIKKGDNLTKIAKKAGIDVKEIVKINGLKSANSITEGKKLLILFNDADYNVSDANKAISKDDEGNEITVIKSDNATLQTRKYLTRNKNNKTGRYTASMHSFEPTKKGNLSGKTIIVNAGHGYKAGGGCDHGTPGLYGQNDEWLINYDNSMRLIEQLRARGAKVVYVQGYSSLVVEALKKCGKADLFISVHANSAGNTKDRTQFYYRDDMKNDGNNGSKSITLAKLAEKNFDKWIAKNEKIKDADRFYFKGKQDYAQAAINDKRTGILKKAINIKHVPSILWEVAFMTSQKGRERLNDSKLMNSYASVLADVVEQYFDENQASSKSESGQNNSSKDKTHKIKPGETLGSIAQKYNTTVANLKKLNNIKDDAIVSGRTLIIKKG